MEMTFYERIKQMTEKEMKMFIYWVYQNGWTDHGNACEDSPGDWSFFGGAICNKPAEYVEAKLDDYYDMEWRDEPLSIWCFIYRAVDGREYKFERKLRSNIIEEEADKFEADILAQFNGSGSVTYIYEKDKMAYCGRFDEWLEDQNGGKDADVE